MENVWRPSAAGLDSVRDARSRLTPYPDISVANEMSGEPNGGSTIPGAGLPQATSSRCQFSTSGHAW